MPRGLVRFQQTGNFHFLTFSCYQRKPFLSPSQARNTFEASLEQTRIRYRFVISGYVVMPEHVHLLVSEPRNGELMRAIQALKISVARRLPQRPFWQRRYYDFNVHSGEKVTEKLNYIHKNPVKRGLVTKPEDWPWSSYRHYQTGERGTVEIESFWTAPGRGGTPFSFATLSLTLKMGGHPCASVLDETRRCIGVGLGRSGGSCASATC